MTSSVVNDLASFAQSARSYLWPVGCPTKIVDTRISCDPLHALEELQVGRHPACTLVCQALCGLRVAEGCPRHAQALFVVLTYLLIRRGVEALHEGHDLSEMGNLCRLTESAIIGSLQETALALRYKDESVKDDEWKVVGGVDEEGDGGLGVRTWGGEDDDEDEDFGGYKTDEKMVDMVHQSLFSFVNLTVGTRRAPEIVDRLIFRVTSFDKSLQAVFHHSLCLLGGIEVDHDASYEEDAISRLREDFAHFLSHTRCDAIFCSGPVHPVVRSLLQVEGIPCFDSIAPHLVHAIAALAQCQCWESFDAMESLESGGRSLEVHVRAVDERAACYPLYRGVETSAWYQTQALHEFDDTVPWEVTVIGCANTVATILLQMPCEALLRMQHAHALDELRSGTSPQVGKDWVEHALSKIEALPSADRELVGDVLKKLHNEYHNPKTYVAEKLGPLSAAVRRASHLASVLLRSILIKPRE